MIYIPETKQHGKGNPNHPAAFFLIIDTWAECSASGWLCTWALTVALTDFPWGVYIEICPLCGCFHIHVPRIWICIILCVCVCCTCLSYSEMLAFTLTAFLELMDHGIVSWDMVSITFIKQVRPPNILSLSPSPVASYSLGFGVNGAIQLVLYIPRSHIF